MHPARVARLDLTVVARWPWTSYHISTQATTALTFPRVLTGGARVAYVEVYDHCLHLTRPNGWAPVRVHRGGKRGRCMGFSASSRRRIKRLLACVNWDTLPPAHFVTLTYHDVPPDWLARFRAFLQVLRREDTVYLWRVELQRRGAPHFHLILWSNADTIDHLRTRWHDIANPESRHHRLHGFDSSRLGSYRSACAYLRKYITKVDDREWIAETELAGRRVWGASRTLPINARVKFDITESGYVLLKRISRRLLRARRTARNRAQSDRRPLPMPRATFGSYAIWLDIESDVATQMRAWVRTDIEEVDASRRKLLLRAEALQRWRFDCIESSAAMAAARAARSRQLELNIDGVMRATSL